MCSVLYSGDYVVLLCVFTLCVPCCIVVIMLSYYVFYSMCSVLYSGDYVVLLCVFTLCVPCCIVVIMLSYYVFLLYVFRVV